MAMLPGASARAGTNSAAIVVALDAIWRLAVLAALAACSPAKEFHRLSGQTMGTEYALTLSGGGDCTAALADPVEAELLVVNAQMSTWQPDSELSRFNATRAGEWIPVSGELAGVVTLAQDLAHQSDGAFDVTVGPLVDLWGFGARERRGMPTQSKSRKRPSRWAIAICMRGGRPQGCASV